MDGHILPFLRRRKSKVDLMHGSWLLKPRIFRIIAVLSLMLCCWCAWLVAGLIPASRFRAQQSSTVLQGTWTARAGPTQVFRGAWSAEILPGSPNTARGSWTLWNDRNEMVLEGTWSASKTGRDWQGSWTARAATGQSFTGGWNADLSGSALKTIQDMFERTAQKEVAGSWRSGRYQGNWWCKGSVVKK